MDYRIEIGGMVLSGTADVREVAVLARELAGVGGPMLALPVAGEVREVEEEPAPRQPAANGQKTLEFTMPASVHDTFSGYVDMSQVPSDIQTARGGSRHVYNLTAASAVHLYELVAVAMDEGAGSANSNAYTVRRRLQEMLDHEFKVKV